MIRSAGLALALGGAIAAPLTALHDTPVAEARSLVPLPSVRLPGHQPGYLLATDQGDVLPFGAAASASAPVTTPANPAVGVARTTSGAGTWTATADGGVFTSGDARFYGSLGGKHLNRTVVDVASTPTGKGYWLASSDGGVFAFGDARFNGSLVGTPVNGRIVALVPTPTGRGYWLASSDGGVFTFGDARFHGSAGRHLQAPVTAMATTPSGRGYWLASSDGGVFTFGDARFHGRPERSQFRGAVAGIAPSRTGRGYWIATTDGGVFTFGDAPFLGSSGGQAWGKVVDIAAGVGRPVPKALQGVAPRVRNRFGNDISWPQCDGPVPAPGYGHGIVGVTGGRPFTRNRCLAPQWRWATAGSSGGGVYINVASPRFGDAAAMHGPAGDCAAHDLPCQTYNHSANNVLDALSYARQAGVDAPMWWIDVEVANRWSANHALNTLTVHAAAETLQKAGRRAGVYSTPYMWRLITGGARNGLPVWVAGAPNEAEAPAWCHRGDKDFSGGGVWLVQTLPIQFDVNYACDPALTDAATTFRFSG